MMEFRELTVAKYAKGTALSLAVGTLMLPNIIVFIVAFFTDQWSRADLDTDLTPVLTDKYYLTGGLWRRCDYVASTVHCRSLILTNEVSSTFMASQGLSIVCAFTLFMAAVSCGAYLLIQRFQRDTRVAIVITVFLYLAAILGVCMCATYSAGFLQDLRAFLEDEPTHFTLRLQWSFGLAIVYTLTSAILAILMTIEIKKSRNMIPA